jgi:hypothetical protein
MQAWVLYLVGVLEAFIALSAIGGGIAMLLGADKFPVEWLRNTPFSDYTIPALVLAIVVGGSSLVAAVEVVTINAPKPSWIEGVYFGLGLAVLGLATYLWTYG